ncbi:MAG: iron-containing alcohol dehydrogenase [Clostridia bacterium]|nr:iron-containing alcohol dehydrogenase [Clostridia bacterium]MBR3553047.1 iron-containing alcohol dehydrogenase [Clostridia bacterium]
MIDAFRSYLPVDVHFGCGALSELPDLLSSIGSDAMVLVCDRFFADFGAELQKKTPAIAAVFSDVEPNPQLSGVETVVQLLKATGATAVAAIGGGSAIDTAKFAAACAFSDRTPAEHFDGAPFPKAHAAIIAVPTTAGTGSEVTGVSVISRGSEKKTTHNPAFYPTACIVDPELTFTVPAKTTLMTGLDAFTHAIEAFWSVNHTPVTDLFAVEALKAIVPHLEASYKTGDKDARVAMAYGSLMAGLAFSTAKTAACHACSYPLSSYHHLPHGEACAFTLDSFIRLNADDRLEELAWTLGFESCDELANEIARLKREGGLRTRLADLDGNADIDRLAKESNAHMLMRNNPVQFTDEALRAMFAALE